MLFLRLKVGITSMVIFGLLSITSLTHPQSVSVGAGSYFYGIPSGKFGPSDQNNNRVAPQVSSNFKQVPQTNTWWTSLIWKYYPNQANSWALYTHPLCVQATPKGADIGYSNQPQVGQPFTLPPDNHTNQEYHYPMIADLKLEISGLNAPQTVVDSYSDWAVTAAWQSNTASNLKMTVAKGNPFVFFDISGGNTVITSTNTPTVWFNTNGVLGVTVNNKHFGIFAPAGTQWSISGNNITSNLNNKSYLSIAVLPDNTQATLKFYQKHAYAFVTDTKVSWKYDEAKAELITTYNVTTKLQETNPEYVNSTILALYRHQWLNTDATLLSYQYASPRGVMKVVEGSTFSTKMTFNGTLPALPHVAVNGQKGFDASVLYNYVDTLYKADYNTRWNNLLGGNQAYWVAKALGRMAQLVHVAHEIKHTKAFELFLSELKALLQSWLTTSNNTTYFYYDPIWKSLIANPPTYFSDTMLNDHHFQYGYFVTAAAAIHQYDPTWGVDEQWGGMIDLLIKDPANMDRSDNRFGFLRNYDVYEGHGWASGHSAFFPGANQEASSESLHFSASLILWGSLTGDKATRDLGIFLYANEVRAVEQYWFDVDKAVFPTGFQKPVLGMVWGDGGGYQTWFESSIAMIHGINFLPLTAHSVYLGRVPNYLRLNLEFMFHNPGRNTDWTELTSQVMALYDPQAALNLLNKNPNFTYEGGDSLAHAYYWINNLNVLGRLNTEITANAPNYNVFDNNGNRTYIAFNPTATAMNVQFSDGTQLAVDPKSYGVKGVPYTPGPTPTPDPTPGPTPTPGQFSATTVEKSADTLSFRVTIPSGSTFADIHFSVNNNSQLNYRMTNNNGVWTYDVAGLKKGDIIKYFVTYDLNGPTIISDNYTYTFQGTPGTGGTGNQYTAGITTQAKVYFRPQWTPSLVTLTYSISGGPKTTINMNKDSNNNWEYIIPALTRGNIITYQFTYDQGGQNFTTNPIQYNI